MLRLLRRLLSLAAWGIGLMGCAGGAVGIGAAFAVAGWLLWPRSRRQTIARDAAPARQQRDPFGGRGMPVGRRMRLLSLKDLADSAKDGFRDRR